MATKKTAELPKTKNEFKEISTGQLVKAGKLLDKDEINAIIMLARSLSDNPLLVDLIKDIENTAAKKIYHDSKTLEDLAAGKAMLYAMDLLKRKILNLSKKKTL